MTFLLRAGEWDRVTPESASWRYLSFRIEHLAGAEERDTGPVETAIVLLEGACTVEADGQRFELGPRAGVFAQLPWTMYLPRDTDYRLEGEAELAIASARCSVRREPVLRRPDEVDVEVRGAGNATRQINNIIQPGFPAERLLVVEVLTPGGNWSSYPPHKHDEDHLPEEALLEEIYYYRAPTPEAFGLQRLYSHNYGIEEAWAVRDGDLLQVPYGYHPFSAAPGYDFYYLNALAGDEHTMAASDDPALAWVRASWADMPKDPRVPLVRE